MNEEHESAETHIPNDILMSFSYCLRNHVEIISQNVNATHSVDHQFLFGSAVFVSKILPYLCFCETSYSSTQMPVKPENILDTCIIYIFMSLFSIFVGV